MKLYLKYMVSVRCEMLVRSELESHGLHCKNMGLGEAEIEEQLTDKQWKELDVALKKLGLELIEDKKSVLIEKIKIAIIDLLHNSEEPLQVNLSEHLSRKLLHDYTYLSNLFSEVQGITIEHFYILHKVELIKELLVYDELNISQIAWKLNYSSVPHLSNQFKKMTGLTPSFFKKIRQKRKAYND